MKSDKGANTGKAKRIVYSEIEERSMDIDFVPPPEKPRQVSGMLKAFCWGLLIFAAVSELFSGDYEPNTLGFLVVRFLIMAVFAAVFSEMGAGMAKNANKNMDFAWVLGFLFGFIGFGVYWAYIKFTSRDKIREKEIADKKIQSIKKRGR